MERLAQARLERALKQLELARTSRELSYSAIPYVLAAIYLVEAAIQVQQDDMHTGG